MNKEKIKYLDTKFYWKLHCIIKNKEGIYNFLLLRHYIFQILKIAILFFLFFSISYI